MTEIKQNGPMPLTATLAKVDAELAAEISTARPRLQAGARKGILDEANAAIMGDRHKLYGDPMPAFACAAQLKSVLRAHCGARNIGLAEMEALDRVMEKVSRIVTGPELHRDSYVDAAGYAAIAGELALRA